MAWTTPRTWAAGEVVTAALLNTHLRDNLKAIGDAWTAYTPTLQGSTTNPTLGTGSVATMRYLQAGKDVRGYFNITFGTAGAAAGSGTYSVTLPVNASSNYNGHSVGRAVIFDSSTSAIGYIDVVASSGILLLRYAATYPTGTLTSVTNAVPWTWAENDYIRGTFAYEAA